MPRVVDAQLQRGEIRAAARRVFAERGVRGTGLTHVADAVGMARSSLYHYYPDKETLLADLVGEMLGKEGQLFRACLRGDGDPLARLERLARACAALFPEWAAFGRMILDLRLEHASFLERYFRELRAELAAVIDEGQRAGRFLPEPPAPVSASVLMAAIDGLLLQYFVDEQALPGAEELAEALCLTVRRVLVA